MGWFFAWMAKYIKCAANSMALPRPGGALSIFKRDGKEGGAFPCFRA
jgi:hypothetical protein